MSRSRATNSRSTTRLGATTPITDKAPTVRRAISVRADVSIIARSRRVRSPGRGSCGRAVGAGRGVIRGCSMCSDSSAVIGCPFRPGASHAASS
ncbi:Uncharacterised protein [Mycobacteroides abscessus subsp. abscessus]|nr:Uncharacterised protein [Mycobacteroides abscessus subsp. abscessus]